MKKKRTKDKEKNNRERVAMERLQMARNDSHSGIGRFREMGGIGGFRGMGRKGGINGMITMHNFPAASNPQLMQNVMCNQFIQNTTIWWD